MPLRLVEVTVPDDRRQALADLVEGEEVLQAWVSGSEGLGTARMLVDAVRAEAVTDGLVERLGSSEGFRIVLLPVEAALPDLSTDDAEGESGDQRPGSRISREELYQDVAHSSRLTSVYLLMVGLSTIVAAVGLTRGDVAIIIGAMVMAPLLGPNIALSLAATLGDGDLAWRSLRATAAGVATAAVLSVGVGAILAVDPSVPELAARGHAGIGDVALGLAAGTGGALASPAASRLRLSA